MSSRVNPYARAYAEFSSATTDHELTVLHDDGLYRHLRMRAPGTMMWGWDVITWPGHLATSGDIADGYVFTRDTDMLAFFSVSEHLRHYYADGAPCIDISYWAEKLVGHDSYTRVRHYDHESFLAQCRTVLEESEDLSTEAISALRSGDGDILIDPDPTEADRLRVRRDEFLTDLVDTDPDEGLVGAQRFLSDHEDIVGDNWWEWDLTGFDHHFVLTCYALELTTRLWYERRDAVA